MAATGWTVTGLVADQFDYAPGRDPVLGTRVNFITSDGHRGTVFVPDDHLSEDTARDLIRAKAAILSGVGRLSEGM